METYFAFTDECGQYNKDRTENFIKAHPFYVRSTVIISCTDYLLLQKDMDIIKKEYLVDPQTEIKWSHFGSAVKNNYKNVPHQLSVSQLKIYFYKILSLLCSYASTSVYYTLTDNCVIGKVDEIALYKMHLQNALQRVQMTVSDANGFAVVVADDLNDKTRLLKKAAYELTSSGDFIKYSNVKKGIYIDFSNQCPGLQLADICAGVFAATLKYEKAIAEEKHKYECGGKLFFSCAYKKTRNTNMFPPDFEVYKIGVKEVPNGAGDIIAKKISRLIAEKLKEDLEFIVRDRCTPS